MAKEGDRIIRALNNNKMVGIMSGKEIMYTFTARNQYLCFIHELDAEDGRYKTWPINEGSTSMISHLADLCDHLFEITPKTNMDPMGVMVAAEKGIVAYLDNTGQLPADDVDFMDWEGSDESKNNNS